MIKASFVLLAQLQLAFAPSAQAATGTACDGKDLSCDGHPFSAATIATAKAKALMISTFTCRKQAPVCLIGGSGNCKVYPIDQGPTVTWRANTGTGGYTLCKATLNGQECTCN